MALNSTEKSPTLTEFVLARNTEAEARIRRGREITPCIVGNTAKGRPPVWRWPYSDTELAACEATRRIVKRTQDYVPELEYGDNGEWAFDHVLRDLAQPYAAHPDFDPAWRV